MEKFEIVPAGRVYANQMAPHLRPSDVLEVHRASGMEPLDALLESVRLSDEDMCWAALYNKLPVAMFGANDITPKDDPAWEGITIGGIWMLCTPGIYRNKLDFMHNCKKYLALMHERYEFLTNFVDADNVPSMRWLPRLGFRPAQQVEHYGYARLPFIQYVSKRS
ncbi:MAG: hypothetical protein ACYTFQ_22470 [Planctomycetota bacterium]|jgi:hypothetical protein